MSKYMVRGFASPDFFLRISDDRHHKWQSAAGLQVYNKSKDQVTGSGILRAMRCPVPEKVIKNALKQTNIREHPYKYGSENSVFIRMR